MDPVQAFLSEEGIARFCTDNYEKPADLNMANLYMHLTNFSLNQERPEFVDPGKNFKDNKEASKQLFTSVMK
jgi:tubulin polyglutamylase TTLL11